MKVALGLHPQLMREEADQLQLFERLLPEVAVVGEIGLDASSRFYATFEEQKRVFARIVRACVEAGGRPMSVHSVRSANQVLRIVRENDPEERNAVALHWFGGDQKLTTMAIDMGCYFSVNEVMLATPRGLSLVEAFPRSKVLTETDGPFIERDGLPVTPSMVLDVVVQLAKLWKTDITAASETVRGNYKLFLACSRPSGDAQPTPRA